MKSRTVQLILMIIWIIIAISRFTDDMTKLGISSLIIAFYCFFTWLVIKQSDEMNELNDEIIEIQNKQITYYKSIIAKSLEGKS